jgi:hypothetical protein
VSATQPEIRVGDWISFADQESFRIGQVLSIRDWDDIVSFKLRVYYTTAGQTETPLEVRRSAP